MALVTTSLKLTDGVDPIKESDSGGSLIFGLGIVIGRQFTVRPSVTIPFGFENTDPSFGVMASLSVGAKR